MKKPSGHANKKDDKEYQTDDTQSPLKIEYISGKETASTDKWNSKFQHILIIMMHGGG
jgi:hypothetical protein